MLRMQLELEIFRQLQMKRKEAPRPSDSSDNSAAGGPRNTAAGGVTGVVATSSGGPVSSCVDSPSSSLSDPSSDPSCCPRSSTDRQGEPLSSHCHGDLPQSLVTMDISSIASSCLKSLSRPHTTLSEPVSVTAGRTDRLPSTAAGQSVGQSSARQCSQPPHRGSRPIGQLNKPSRPQQTRSSVYSVDTGGDTPMTSSQTVSHRDGDVLITRATMSQQASLSQCDTDMSPAVLNTPETLSKPEALSQSVTSSQGVSPCDGDILLPAILNTPESLSQPVTSSQGVSQSADTDSDVSFVAAAAVLSNAVTLSQDTDKSADIQLEALTHDDTVSTSY